ncbi:MAG: hypothetical protein LBQ59_04175 [Candidatus Peribacteria bacterium]|nr:hypothetical protein [Candidatus Peribacteria bacterium]
MLDTGIDSESSSCHSDEGQNQLEVKKSLSSLRHSELSSESSKIFFFFFGIFLLIF